jgi:outer membrane biosynthesis protein TonB
MESRGLQVGGVVVTVLLHAALVVVTISNLDEGSTAAADPSKKFENATTIEAALAFKEVKPQSRQPVKQKKEKYAPPVEETPVPTEEPPPPEPEAPKVDTDNVVEEVEPPKGAKEPPKHKVKPKKDEIDINSTLEKNRSQDEDLSSTGVDEVPQEGSADGSKWGTETDAKGHPYAGELKGRIYSAWTVPSLETGGGEVHGCVKLDEDGKIVDRHVKKKSGNANLDRSVELALKQAPDMEEPVPEDLVGLITVKGICFRFTLKKEEGSGN